MFAWYARLIIRLRFPLLVGWAFLLACAVRQLPRLRFDTSIGPLLEGSGEQVLEVRNFDRALPPVRASVLCTVEWSYPIAQAELIALGKLEDLARAHPGVKRTLSLASISIIRPRMGVPMPGLFMEESPEETALERVGRHPILARWLLSEDGRSAVLLLHVTDPTRTDRLMSTLEQAKPPGTTLHFFARDKVAKTIRDTMIRDLKRGLLLEVLAVGVAMAVLFRTVRGVVISLAVPLSAMLLFLGFSARFGSLSLIEVAVPGLLLVIGLCDAIHLVCSFEGSLADVRDRREAIVRTMDRVGGACLWTSVTTAIGFLSLWTAEHAAVRDLARSAGAGVGLAFLTVITLVPLFLSVWPIGRPAPPARWLYTLRRSLNSPLGLAAGSGCLVLALLGLPRLTVNSRWLEELPPEREVVRELRWYEAQVGGLLKIEVRVRGPVGEPASIRALEALQENVSREEGVTHFESYTLWVREILGNDPDASDAQLSAAAATLRNAGKLFPRHLVTPDFNEARISFSARDMSTKRYLHLKRVLEAEARKLPAGLDAQAAGYGRMAHESSRLVVTTMLRGFVLTLLCVCLLIGLIFRSWRVGLISLLPNALTILVALGVTGWLGIELRIGIVMVFCVGVGLAVDDTIHLLHRFFGESDAHPELPVAERVSAAFRVTGSALFVTSAVLVLSSLCHLPAEFRSLRETGILLAVIVAAAYVADVVLLPRLMVRFL